MIEQIDSGPRTDNTWLGIRADGWTYRLYWYRDEPPQNMYRLDVLDEKGLELIHSEEMRHNNGNCAVHWAASRFVQILMIHKKLPPCGCVLDDEEALAISETE